MTNTSLAVNQQLTLINHKDDDFFTKNELDRQLSNLLQQRGRMDSYFHKLAYSALLQALPVPYGNSDYTYLTRMFQALPQSGRAQSFRSWVEANSPLHLTNKNVFKLNGKLEKNNVIIAMFHLENALAKSYFHKAEVKPPVADFDFLLTMKEVKKATAKAVKTLTSKAVTLDADERQMAELLNKQLQAVTKLIEDNEFVLARLAQVQL